ncbi:MAG: hypothetical protein M3457_17590 [Chloroflexota bacterium]|nr:hypothetical protein [Chloroflexota bacterium]
MPEHVSPINPSPEDRFADALDAITLGLPIRQQDDASLAAAARTIGTIGLHVDGIDEGDPVTLDRTARRRIWADLMREHGGTPEAAPNPKSPGAAGSMLSPNPWLAQSEPPMPKRPRSSSGVLRFIPAAQPTSTFLLVVAVLALVGGAFASLAPHGGQGVFPTALATENPSQLAFASPEASPVADACLVEATTQDLADALPGRSYRSGGIVAPDLHAIYVSDRWEQIVACGPFDGVSGEIPESMMTDRLAATYPESGSAGGPWIVTEDEARAILGYPLAWHELEEMERIYTAAIDANRDFTGDPVALDADLGVYRQLADGRGAFYSGAYWLAEDGRIEPASDPAAGIRVTVHVFAQQDRHWLYDETLLLCIGTCDEFETSGVPKPQLTIATPDAADRQWLTPLTEASCAVSTPESVSAPPTAPAIETDPANYVPFATADTVDREAAATTYLRLTSGCEASGDAPLKTGNGDTILGDPGREGTTQSQIETARAISEALRYGDPIEILIANAEAAEIVSEDGYTSVQKYFVLLPEDVVQLPDGRLGGMLRIQQVSSDPGFWTLEFPATTLFMVFEEVSGQWAIAESFVVCIGQCDDYWSESETTGQSVATATPAPAASPVATRP